MNLISIIIGATLLIFGVICILIKSNSVEYIDTEGLLHENGQGILDSLVKGIKGKPLIPH